MKTLSPWSSIVLGLADMARGTRHALSHSVPFDDRVIHPSFISELSFSSADIPSRLTPVLQQEAGTSRSTIPSMVISGSVIRALAPPLHSRSATSV